MVDNSQVRKTTTDANPFNLKQYGFSGMFGFETLGTH
jgi:hypothetical protein